jgi:hypothetical protein
MTDDDNSLTYYSAYDLELDVCGNPFAPSDHFFDSEESVEQLYAHSMDGFDVNMLNEHVFPDSHYRSSAPATHALTTFTTPDGGGYGWMTAMSNLFKTMHVPKPYPDTYDQFI